MLKTVSKQRIDNRFPNNKDHLQILTANIIYSSKDKTP